MARNGIGKNQITQYNNYFNNREEPDRFFIFLQLLLHIYSPKNCEDVCKNDFLQHLEENFSVDDVNMNVENLLLRTNWAVYIRTIYTDKNSICARVSRRRELWKLGFVKKVVRVSVKKA